MTEYTKRQKHEICRDTPKMLFNIYANRKAQERLRRYNIQAQEKVQKSARNLGLVAEHAQLNDQNLNIRLTPFLASCISNVKIKDGDETLNRKTQ